MNFFSIDDGDHSVEVIVESGELAEIVPDAFVGGVEDVRSVSVDHDSVYIAIVKTVACDMVTAIDNGDSGVCLRGIQIGNDGTGHPCANDQNLLHAWVWGQKFILVSGPARI